MPSSPLPPGTPAPDFTLPRSPTERVSLRELRGRPVVIAFYPADWSPVCGDQMSLYSALHDVFEEHSATVLGISVDGAWCHSAFTEARHLHIPLLADFEPKGEVSRRYGAYNDAEGTSDRSLFVIDAGGIIHWSYRSPPEVNPGADGILEALGQLAVPLGGRPR